MEPFVLFNTHHQVALGICGLVLIGAFVFSRMASSKWHDKVRYGLAAAMFLIPFAIIGIEVQDGMTSWQTILPLHMCDVAVWINAYALWTLCKEALEIGFFWGWAAGLNALLTPELTFTYPHLYFVPFFIWHGVMLLAPLYIIFTTNLRPSHRGIYRAMGALVALAIVAGIVDWLIGANYLFLSQKPNAGNITAIMPDWPWYVLLLGVVGWVYFYILYTPFFLQNLWQKWRKNTR